MNLDGVPEEIYDEDFETRGTAKVIVDIVYLTDCKNVLREPAVNRAPTAPIPEKELKLLAELSRHLH